MYTSFDEALGMISNLFSGWPWTIMLFLNNNYVIVLLGKKCLKIMEFFFQGYDK